MKSIIQQEKVCYFCGNARALESHHIFGGANRVFSEKYGLKVWLCARCHRDNKTGVHADDVKMQYLHRIGQQAFEKTHSRDEFRKVFGRNYLKT